MRVRVAAIALLLCAGLWMAALRAVAPQTTASFDPALFAELHWRNIGPFRGGRTKAVDGIPSQPNVFYVAAVNGGVWKTTDYGRTWRPIFDDQPTGSVGALAIAPSDPNIIYVGSGEGMQRPDLSTGDGIYKSTDAGKTWAHLSGLRDGQQIPQIVVDPKNPNRLFVAVLGHPYGPNPDRGVFRSLDGGRTFDKVLYRDENTGAVDLTFDPVDPNTLYASLWESRQAPWENGVWNGAGSGLYKTTDGGSTWKPLTQGLPSFAEGLGRIGVTVAPSNRNRLFAVVDAGPRAGIYRSDDAGETWTRINSDPRVVGRPTDAADIRVHPTNPDVVFVPSIVTWKSTDGGRTFTGFRGAPGGDDYQKIWINPLHPDVMILTSDQGAIVSTNAGESWGSWYNQPTAQFYHVSADNAFPYRVCGGQQESGSACVASRGDQGQITFREWTPVAVEEYGYVAPDPMDPDLVFGGKVSRFDRRTGQAFQVGPARGPSYRTLRTAPLMFAPLDPRTLLFASNTLWKTSNGGLNWSEISPDLTRASWTAPASVGAYRNAPTAQFSRRAVIYTIAPSSVDPGVIWAGTDDGLIHVTHNGGVAWTDVTPSALTPWAKVSIIEASHFDPNTAYAAINTLRLDDLRPHLYRTRDAGKTWKEIIAGLPEHGVINVVREDPGRRGLLFAGSEQSVSVSFDDGESWQGLRLNMPATSIRDLAIKDADLIAGTHGRGFWILDDITPLRQVTADIVRAPAYLFGPATAWRFRWNKNTDTPLPPDEPAAPNPADGVVISYHLSMAATSPVVLEIIDTVTGDTVRRYSSDDPPDLPVEGRNIPDYWIRPVPRLQTTAGLHRFVWDVRYAPPAVDRFDYPIAAVAMGTPTTPQGIFVLPGTFQIRLTVDGQSYRRAVSVRIDPRVKTSPADLSLQFTLSRTVDQLMRRLMTVRADVAKRPQTGTVQASLADLTAAYTPLPALLETLQEADARPLPAVETAVNGAIKRAQAALAAYGAEPSLSSPGMKSRGGGS